MDYKIGFIGVGNMATAIISSVLSSGEYDKSEINLYEVDNVKRDKIQKEGFHLAKSEVDVIKSSHIVFLAIKPSELKTVLNRIASAVSLDNVLVSIVAGVSIAFIKKTLKKECKIVRLMPNTPITIGAGATAMSYEMPITYSELNIVKAIFEESGIVEVLPEDKMNEVVSVNGSSPAYVYMLIRAMLNGAISQGIDEDIAKRLILQTIAGTVELAAQSSESIDDLLKKVCAPNGTTIKAVELLEKRNFEQAIGDAMLACTKRSSQLERELESE